MSSEFIENSKEIDRLKSLFSEKVKIAVSKEVGDVAMLYDEERKLISHASQKRQQEFAVGRLCARDALADLGIDQAPVLMDTKGAPIWPEGVTGSIAHTNKCCAAVVALQEDENSLGLDIEEVDRVKESIWSHIFVPEEIEWLQLQSDESQQWASVLFAAKEAFYKAQYPLTHLWVGFQDVAIEVDQNTNKFKVRLLLNLGEWSQDEIFQGSYCFFDNYVAVGISVIGGFR